MTTKKMDGEGRRLMAARVPDKLYRAVQHLAVDSDRPVEDVITEALATFVHRHGGRAAAEVRA